MEVIDECEDDDADGSPDREVETNKSHLDLG